MAFASSEENQTGNFTNFSCTDSDGGKNYFVKGLTKQIGGGCYNVTDGNDTNVVCVDPAPPVEDKCITSTLANSVLKEYLCNGTSYTFEEYTCPNGCLNGACLNQTIRGNDTCTEDDDCNSGYECENGLCVLEDEDDDDNETEDGCEWQCSKWSACLNGTQTRTCANVNNCAGETPKQSKSCKEGKENKVCCKSTETEDNKTKIEYEWEDRTSCLEEDEDEVKEIVNNSFCKEKNKEKQRIKFEDRTGVECPDECRCQGVTMKCEVEGGREMTVFASSGNIIIQIKGINMTTNVTLYKVNNTIVGNFSDGERPIILPDEVEIKIKERIKAKKGELRIELGEDGIYQVELKKKVRLFFIIPTGEKVRVKINAEHGYIIKIKNPWWGFLARDSRE
ncbi:hypothetical protein HYT23_01145 [Candidatus Pacearchaeota archaeon]|nr:hypothetical protein [Candidatus Pacearchaeota archaeon]